MKKRKALILITMIMSALAMMCGCSNQKTESVTESGSQKTDNITGSVITGIKSVQATSTIYSSSFSIIDYIIIEYNDEIVLPNENPEKLFSFIDKGIDGNTMYDTSNNTRRITGVYASNQPQISETDDTNTGKYLIVQLEPIENPNQDSKEAWEAKTTAGLTVWMTSGNDHYTFRRDYSELEITQKFDAVNKNNQLIFASGKIPELVYDNITWPEFEGFTIDKTLAGKQGDIHYSYYLPLDYDSSKEYPMMVALPGYGGLLFSGGDDTAGVNVFADKFNLVWTQQEEEMIVLAPQLTDWREKSATQTIELVDYFLVNYSVDTDRIYGMGYSGGGETMSRVLSTQADLFAAYLHVSSRWAGNFSDVVENQLPVYIAMAKGDEYYGSETAQDNYDTFREFYLDEGLLQSEIDKLLVLNIPDNDFFNRYGFYSYHGGGMAFANDPDIIEWVLQQKKGSIR